MYKIAIIGPESTGKSELAQALALHYNGIFVPEYARTYVEQLERDYTFDDVCRIAIRQIEEQLTFKESQVPVFFDTEMIITKVWLEHCYQNVPVFVEENIQSNYFDLYLICYPDLPWVPDPVREHGGDERIFFYNWYLNEARKTGRPQFIISGIDANRTNNAIRVIDDYMALNKK